MALKAAAAVVVAATRTILILLSCGFLPARAGVLPDDRADVMYHSYDGGGVEITGPSILVLKKIGQDIALRGNYYVDSISSASIDVVTSGASKYSEDRTELSASVDYMHGNSIMSLSYTNSDESDYEGNTASFGVSMDMFSNMTTVNLGYAYGWDTVENNTDPTFSENIDRQNYRLGVSQVLSKDMVVELNAETITDEGFLNNPYRSVRYVDAGSALGYSFQSEAYPKTRTSNAVALRSIYYLPYRASVSGEYRFFNDSWDITAHNIKFSYTHPLASGWLLEGKYRYYTQTAADFYSDLFPFRDAQNFLARDKELSKFNSNTAGIAVSYDFIKNSSNYIDRGSINFSYDHIWFDYDDFRDLRETGGNAGSEPLYDFTADVIQVFLSVWF